MGSSSTYRRLPNFAVAGLFLLGLFMCGIAIYNGIQLSGDLILGTTLILVETALATVETISRSSANPARIGKDQREALGTPLLLGASQYAELDFLPFEQE